MLLKSAHFRNSGPFKDYRFEVGELRGVVALVAPNGTGKSYTLEAGILGAAYRKLETQGTLIGRATDRESWVESDFVYGEPFRVRQVVDGVTRASETLLLDGAGAPILADTKVSTYDEQWVARRLPDLDVYLAGPFCAQKSAGFAGMKSSARIDVILRVLGVARLERAAKNARERATKAESEFKALVERIKDARGDVGSVEAAEAALCASQEAAAAADAALASAKAALSRLQQEASAHAVRKTSRQAADTLVTTLQGQLAAAAARRTANEVLVTNNRGIQADGEAIRAAAARLESENAQLTRLELALAEADKAIAAELDPWRDGAQRLKAALQRAASAKERLMNEGAVLAAVADQAVVATAVEAERTAVAALEAELEALQAKGWANDKEARASLRASLVEVVLTESLDDAHAVASCGVAKDDSDIQAATETPKQLAELKKRLARERDHLGMAEQKAKYLAALAARLPDVEAARADLAAAELEVAELRQGHALAVIGAFARALGRAETRAAARAAGAALEATHKLAKRLQPLEDSTRRIAELERLIAADRAEEARVQTQLEAVELVDVGEEPDVIAAQDVLSAAEGAAKTRAADAVKAEQALARAREVAAKVAGLEAQRDAAAAELADWNRLALDLGRKGIQSAEVDSAGPELTALCNDLLHRCHGPRYTVEVKTQRLDAKGKNLVEECIVTVIDSVKGTVKEVSEHSGGECTILAEALSLALTMMGCKRAGFSDFTIVRDESGAALDPINNRAYVAMLRHAIAVTGARHVLLVSHSESVQKLCDHIVRIGFERPEVT